MLNFHPTRLWFVAAKCTLVLKRKLEALASCRFIHSLIKSQMGRSIQGIVFVVNLSILSHEFWLLPPS